MSGDGPLFIKRVYKGKVPENPVHGPSITYFLSLYLGAFHLKTKFALKNRNCFEC